MGQLAIESGRSSVPEPTEEDVWAAPKLAGFKEVGTRKEHGVDLVLLWREVGNMVLLGAHRETDDQVEHVLTLVSAEEAMDSLEHPVHYFSHDASDRIFGQAA